MVAPHIALHRKLPDLLGARAGRGTRWLPLIGLGAVLDTLSALALPMMVGRAVDAMVAGQHSGRWLAAVVATIVLGVAGDLVAGFSSSMYTTATTARLRDRLIRHVLAVGPMGMRPFETGDLTTRVTSNAADAAHSRPGKVLVVAALLPPVGSLVMLAVIDLWTGAAFLASIVLVAQVLRTFTRRSADITARYQQTQGELAARLAESLEGARTVAAAGTVEREERRVLTPLPDLRRYGERAWRVASRSSAQAAIVGPCVLLAVLVVGGLALVDGRITAGDLLAASRYAVLGAGLGGLTGVLGRVARARAGRRRVDEVLAVEPIRYGGRDLPDVSPPGGLEFRGVTVQGTGPALLEDVEFSLPGGITVAVVGHSGAGKSILAAVAARLYDPTAGTVLLDGVPLNELSQAALRGAVGCAFERPNLVGRTVGDAIGSGLDRAVLDRDVLDRDVLDRDVLDRDVVRAAARATHAHEFVTRFPQSYETPLSEAPMSGGEMQRLGLARAWRANRLLVLDDATSSLDMITEMRVNRALDGDRDRRTRLMVTHRAATAARADLVLWLDHGRLRAIGPHHRLWRDPDYRKVFE